MKTAYVLGENANKSLSPLIFNYWLEKNKIKAKYISKQIEPKNFNKELDHLLQNKDTCGLNITIPFKEAVLKKIDHLDSHSIKIGAVNCLTRKKDIWFGNNTDWLGFLASISDKSKKIKKDTAIVIGYGGAAKAIIYGLGFSGFKKIKIFNRTFKKIEKISDNKKVEVFELNELMDHIYNSSIIVNTTPTDVISGLKKIEDQNMPLVSDIVYAPKETNFLSHFPKSSRIYGISMLLYQAVPCFEKWFGVKPIIDKELLGLLNERIS